METTGFTHHDHRACVAQNIAMLEAHCAKASLQLTPVRRRVFEILLERHKAFGAYELLDRLKKEGYSPHPPMAYRALNFLRSNGFVHKVERLNGFIACAHPGGNHAPAFLICRVCDAVAEVSAETARDSLGRTAQAAGFEVERAVVEAEGICPNCQPPAVQ